MAAFENNPAVPAGLQLPSWGVPAQTQQGGSAAAWVARGSSEQALEIGALPQACGSGV